MAAPYLVTPNADLDFLLAQVAKALQLTAEQHRLAAQHYKAVGEWLGAAGSPLARYQPWIYPHGSMALETTVRPQSRIEYDLDLVCHMLRTGMTALEVYNAVHARLTANPKYAPMVEKKNRCVRLNYDHEFHLDILPAEPDPAAGGDSIRVPDRELRDWMPSNPKGYLAWFTQRSRVTLVELRKKLDPFPRPTPAEEKPPLTIAVQLMKRRRDLVCDEDGAPRSIVLTTLAAEYYRGTDCVLTAIAQIVAGIQRRIRDAHPNRITVCNPTNAGERFCESFNPPGRYEAFIRFIDRLERDITEIAGAEGIGVVEQQLTKTFGAGPTGRAITAYGELLKSRRDSGALGFVGGASGGLSIVSGVGHSHTAPRNAYFGGQGGK